PDGGAHCVRAPVEERFPHHGLGAGDGALREVARGGSHVLPQVIQPEEAARLIEAFGGGGAANRRRAASRAASGVMPSSTSRSVSRSMCDRISSAKSSCARLRRHLMLTLEPKHTRFSWLGARQELWHNVPNVQPLGHHPPPYQRRHQPADVNGVM